MRRGAVRIGVAAGAAFLLTMGGQLMHPGPCGAVVLICKKGSKLVLRQTACKRHEQVVNASEFGATGPQGASGQTGSTGPMGPPGPFLTALPSGQTVRGDYNIGGTAAAGGALANTHLSFIFPLAAPPTAHLVLTGSTPPAQCTGDTTFPQAAPGHLCIYENSDRLNTGGILLNGVERAGATIFINSTSSGSFYSYGTWAVTAP